MKPSKPNAWLFAIGVVVWSALSIYIVMEPVESPAGLAVDAVTILGIGYLLYKVLPS